MKGQGDASQSSVCCYYFIFFFSGVWVSSRRKRAEKPLPGKRHYRVESPVQHLATDNVPVTHQGETSLKRPCSALGPPLGTPALKPMDNPGALEPPICGMAPLSLPSLLIYTALDSIGCGTGSYEIPLPSPLLASVLSQGREGDEGSGPRCCPVPHPNTSPWELGYCPGFSGTGESPPCPPVTDVLICWLLVALLLTPG